MESITGIGNVNVDNAEYVSPTVLQQYAQQILNLKTLLDKRSGTDYTPTVSDYNAIVQAINNITTLAKSGVQSSGFTSYLNQDLADNLNSVMGFFQAAGIPTASGASDDTKIAAVTQWQDLAGFGLENVLTQGLLIRAQALTAQDVYTNTQGQVVRTSVTLSPGTTLQGMLETEYIASGNQLIASNLSSLQTALSATQNAVNILNVLQNYMNGITLNMPAQSFASTFTLPTGGSLDDFKTQYRAAASAYFKQLIPQGVLSNTAAEDLYAAKIRLNSVLVNLEKINPTQNNRNIPNTLANQIYLVLKDISAQFSAVGYTGDINNLYLTNPTLFESTFRPAVQTWVLDGQQKTIGASTLQSQIGAIQNHLSIAVSSAQNLNDTQRDNVRSYMYVFQQFYKTASTMLDMLTQAIQKIGQNTDGKK